MANLDKNISMNRTSRGKMIFKNGGVVCSRTGKFVMSRWGSLPLYNEYTDIKLS